MGKIKFFPDNLDIQNQKIILRLDLNVPLKDKVIQDDTRIALCLPFIRRLLEKKLLQGEKQLHATFIDLTKAYDNLIEPHSKPNKYHDDYLNCPILVCPAIRQEPDVPATTCLGTVRKA